MARRKRWSSLSDDEKTARVVSWLALQVLSWLAQRLAVFGLKRFLARLEARPPRAERLQWANREGKYADPTTPLLEAKPTKSFNERLAALSSAERLEWANREGKYADPNVEP